MITENGIRKRSFNSADGVNTPGFDQAIAEKAGDAHHKNPFQRWIHLDKHIEAPKAD